MAKRDSKPKEQLPRALSPDLALQPTTYRAGLYVELQKFGDNKGDRQMLLSEAMAGGELAQDSSIEVTGLDFSVSEDKAFSALQILLDRTDYQGNIPGKKASSPSYKWEGTLPRLSLTYSEYFEAYGLQRKGDGSYYGRQADEALEALDSLTQSRRIVYRRRVWKEEGKKRRQVSDIIVHKGPVITTTAGYRELDEQEASEIVAGQDKPQRVTRLEIDFSPLLIDGLEEGFWLLKPTTLHQEIKALLGKRRVSRAVSLFLEWLLTLSLPKISIARDKLATKLRLDYLIEQRKQARIDERIEEAIKTALELGFLSDSQQDAFGVLHFTLNPERMGRPPKWKLEEGEGEEEDSS